MKSAKTIDEQIELLKDRGLVVLDEKKAKEILMDVGFYRLGFYLFPFEKSFPLKDNRDHSIITNITFDDVVKLYYFDSDLRNILTYYLNRVEISLRTYITYTISVHYKTKPTWFVDSSYLKKGYIDAFEKKVYSTIKENPVIQRHHKKYINDRFAPAWKTMEFMTLGNIVSLYRNLKDSNLQLEIANHYGCNTIKIFLSYIETIRVLRNTCAHGACLYNINLALGIKSGPAGLFKGEDRHNINGAIKVVEYVLGRISQNRQNDMKSKILNLLLTSRSDSINSVINKCANLNTNSIAN